MTDALRFCVVRETTNTYQVTVYDPAGRILRENSNVHVAEIMDKLGFELEQLQSRVSVPRHDGDTTTDGSAS
jgi:hypothetical protein